MSETREGPRTRQRAGRQSLQIAGNANGSALATAGGVSIVINQVQAVAETPERTEPTVAEVVSNLLALGERERRSFMRFARTKLEDRDLASVDAATLKRMHAYASAILSRRAQG